MIRAFKLNPASLNPVGGFSLAGETQSSLECISPGFTTKKEARDYVSSNFKDEKFDYVLLKVSEHVGSDYFDYPKPKKVHIPGTAQP